MYLTVFLVIIMLQGSFVTGIDLNSLFGKIICYDDRQDQCNEDFTDAYPELSKSVTNLTLADTGMLLYTRKSSEPEKLHKCAGRLPPSTNFNPENEVIVILMPFIGSFCNVAVYREWVIQLLEKGDYNIIVIDYSWGNQLDYATAILNARLIVKNQTVILLNNIEEQIGVPFKRVTFIGHSLGAQLAGMIGADFPLDRIIGLDPAGPGFAKDKTPLDNRLDPSDAKLVEVWHCNAGDCFPNLGINYEAGHVNFYINGGTIQKACVPYSLQTLSRGDMIYGLGTLLLPTTCWHAHCAVYFKVSINPENCQFIGIKCDSKSDYQLGKCRGCGHNGENCLIMGFDTYKYINEIPSTPEVYFVDTSVICPFCVKKYAELDGDKDTYKSSLQQSRCKKKG